ncbi:MAG: AEC family transporter [Treponema sp.]|jgi:predicted permease|nr:AEC family transporter [Treponema sp.]
MHASSQVLALFILILTGFACAKLKITGPLTADHFSKFVINVTLPALLFASFQRPFSSELLGEAGLALGLSAIVYGMAFLTAFFYPRLLKIKSPERGVHRYALIISNCGFIGYPVVEAVLGPDYVFHAVIFNIPFSFLAFSVCAWLIYKESAPDDTGSKRLNRKAFINPNLVAVILGLLFFVFSVTLPQPVFRGLKMIGDMTTPLSMILIGITLAQADIRRVFGRWQIYATVIMRLVILPSTAGLIFYLLGIRGPLFILGVLITAMPAGSATSILASLYKTAEGEASSLVFLSTLLCMVTVPVVIAVTAFFG